MELMKEDHVFVDSGGGRTEGREECLEIWQEFFSAFPGYKNIFETIGTHGDLVVMVGRSVTSDERLEGSAIWTAEVRDGGVVEWRVYEDTKENRSLLDIDLV